MNICEIHVYLLDEGLDVWRPVKAKKVGVNRYIYHIFPFLGNLTLDQTFSALV